jgi:hypothetical protein
LQVISISQDVVVPDDVIIVSVEPAPVETTTIGLLEGPATAETAALIQAGFPGDELAQTPVLTDPADPAAPTTAAPAVAPAPTADPAATPVGTAGAPSTTVTPVTTGTTVTPIATGTTVTPIATGSASTATGSPATTDGTTAVTATAPANGLPHLPSPDSPPPGTSDEPVGTDTNPNVSYLKDLWHAVQNQEIDRSDLLLALTQRSFTAPLPSGTNSSGVMTDPSLPASTGAASTVPAPAGTVSIVPAAAPAAPVLIPAPVPAEVPADQ